jgi:hypothetical protein
MPTNEECHSNLGWHKLASLTQDGRAEAVGLKSLDAGEFQVRGGGLMTAVADPSDACRFCHFGLKWDISKTHHQYWIATKPCESLGSLQEVNPLRDGDLGSF